MVNEGIYERVFVNYEIRDVSLGLRLMRAVF